jgi:tRNA modification GTPase
VLGDTIFATASAPGASARAVVRISGPLAFAAAESALRRELPRARCQCEGTVHMGHLTSPAFALCMPGPRSYTGEDCVELHLVGSPVLIAEVAAQMCAACGPSLRPALPGEFTARACQNGRMDMAQAEGVLMLIHGEDAREAARGASWLAGGLSAAVGRVRSLAQDALALVEAGLDFEAGDTGEVDESLWRDPLVAAHAEAIALVAAMPRAIAGGEVLLLGRSNAGKSSLCNALAQRDAALVDAVSGTTRDVLRVELAPGVAVWDAPGDLENPLDVDRAALTLRNRLAGRASSAMVVVDSADVPSRLASSLPCLCVVWTKRDLRGEPSDADRERLRRAAPFTEGAPQFVVSASTWDGLPALRAFLAERSRRGAADPGGPQRHAATLALAALERAVASPQAELASQDLQEALAALGRIDGQHGVEDLLDRIYRRFCMGK